MNAKITLVELAELMAEATSTTKRVCELFLRELFATVSQALIDGEQVKINGVGTFKVTEVKPRKSVDVSTGKAIEIVGHKKITFTPVKSLAEAVNQPFEQFETVFLDDVVTDEKLAEIDQQYPSAVQTPVEPEEQLSETEPTSEDEAQNVPFAPLPDDLPEMQGAAPTPELEELVTPQPAEPIPVTEDDEAIDKHEEELVAATTIEQQEIVVEKKDKEKVVTEETQALNDEHPQEPSVEQPKSRPMLVGIPIDGPSHPVPEPEPVFEPDPNERFYRPEPRNTYTPTPEQIAAAPRHRDKRWLWILLALAVAGLLLWLFTRGGGQSNALREDHVVVEADTVVTEPEVITDTVTSKIVLSTLSDRYYDSPWFWVYIYEENKSMISDPNNVKPGTVVVIPPAEKYGIDAKDPASLKKAQLRSWEILKGR